MKLTRATARDLGVALGKLLHVLHPEGDVDLAGYLAAWTGDTSFDDLSTAEARAIIDRTLPDLERAVADVQGILGGHR